MEGIDLLMLLMITMIQFRFNFVLVNVGWIDVGVKLCR